MPLEPELFTTGSRSSSTSRARSRSATAQHSAMPALGPGSGNRGLQRPGYRSWGMVAAGQRCHRALAEPARRPRADDHAADARSDAADGPPVSRGRRGPSEPGHLVENRRGHFPAAADAEVATPNAHLAQVLSATLPVPTVGQGPEDQPGVRAQRISMDAARRSALARRPSRRRRVSVLLTVTLLTAAYTTPGGHSGTSAAAERTPPPTSGAQL